MTPNQILSSLVVLLLFFALAACEPIAPLSTEYAPSEELNAFQLGMLEAVNQVREEGCTCGDQYYPPTHALVWNAMLGSAAKRHAKDMARHDKLNHRGSDGSTFSQRIQEAGYRFSKASENIAYGFPTIKDAIEGWKNSAVHCRNMMDPGVSELGAASLERYWTQNFASPLE